jgi:hypothetical protein
MRNKLTKKFVKQIPRIIAIVILILAYIFAMPTSIDEKETEDLSKLFCFNKYPLYFPIDINQAFKRDVHPQYKKIEQWISSVGSSVAFFDCDMDQLENDIINIDVRYSKIFISPAPNTGSRFTPFELTTSNVKFDPCKMAPNGLIVYDFNEDGRSDILILYLGRTPILFYNLGENKFEDIELTSEYQMWDSTTGVATDINGDGHADIVIGNYFPDTTKLIYADATDNDQIMMNSMSRANNGALNRLFVWKGIENGKAKFEELKDWYKDFYIPCDWTLAIGAADLNGDMLPEIYIANDFGPDKLLFNTTKNGEISFKEIFGKRRINTTRSNVLGKDSYKGMGVDFNDINNDGLFDIYISNLADTFALFESHFLWVNNGKTDILSKGKSCFENQSEKYGLSRSSWGWDSKLGDFNNDRILEAVQATGFFKGKINRWPELQEFAEVNDYFVESPDRWPQFKEGDDLSGNAHLMFFVKSSLGKYFDISARIGLDENLMTRGIALSDVDHDGKLDMAVSSQWENSYFYNNTSKNENSFLGLQIKIPIEDKLDDIVIDGDFMLSRYAVGTIVRINLENGEKLIRQVDGGNGHTGVNSKEILFGLGSLPNNKEISVEINWIKSDKSVRRDIVRLLPGWHTIYLPF